MHGIPEMKCTGLFMFRKRTNFHQWFSLVVYERPHSSCLPLPSSFLPARIRALWVLESGCLMAERFFLVRLQLTDIPSSFFTLPSCRISPAADKAESRGCSSLSSRATFKEQCWRSIMWENRMHSGGKGLMACYEDATHLKMHFNIPPIYQVWNIV